MTWLLIPWLRRPHENPREDVASSLVWALCMADFDSIHSIWFEGAWFCLADFDWSAGVSGSQFPNSWKWNRHSNKANSAQYCCKSLPPLVGIFCTHLGHPACHTIQPKQQMIWKLMIWKNSGIYAIRSCYPIKSSIINIILYNPMGSDKVCVFKKNMKFAERLTNWSHTVCEYFAPYQTTPSKARSQHNK